MNKLGDTIQKGKSNGQRKAYNHLMSTGVFGVADKVAEFRKPRQPRNKKRG